MMATQSDPAALTGFAHAGTVYPNRIVLSPLTRARASSDAVPGMLQAGYYRQRASAGLMISEAIAVAPEGRGGAWTPGLFSEEQVSGWRLTTEAVHGAGGRIFAQLWHAGRLAHSSFHPLGHPPVSPVEAIAPGKAFTEQGFLPYELPHRLTAGEVAALIDAYRRAAHNAIRAGFDGIEIHAGHGYLLDSFLRDAINDRDDRYGGCLENRARLLVEVIEQTAASVGADRVSVRLSPNTRVGGMSDSDPDATFGYVVDRMNALGIAWLDLVEGDNMVTRTVEGGADTDLLARNFKGAVILNHGYDFAMANDAIATGKADMIAFGRPFIANPDLVDRFRRNLPLAEAARSTWYGGGGEGLIDFPSYAEASPSPVAG